MVAPGVRLVLHDLRLDVVLVVGLAVLLCRVVDGSRAELSL